MKDYFEPYFGTFGGQFVAETLVEPLEDLAKAFKKAIQDQAFVAEMEQYNQDFVGRPTSITFCKRSSELMGGAKIYLKREDLNHTGAHKINNALGQAMLAKVMGKSRIVAETGAGQHGVATATVCALLGLECTIYMGSLDAQRQQPNVQRMKLLGAQIHEVETGSRTLKDAINEALRDWITNIRGTHYLIGSVVGPAPFPAVVRYFQSVIGRESRAQMLELTGKLPDMVIACVGGGSNAIGIFQAFLDDATVALLGVQAGGEAGHEKIKRSAPLLHGSPGILHGAHTKILQDFDGQILESHSIAPGLDYPGVGPEHSSLAESGRVHYVEIDDSEALESFEYLSVTEGIIPALESSHAFAQAKKEAVKMTKEQTILVNLSGRGDKDLSTAWHAIQKGR